MPAIVPGRQQVQCLVVFVWFTVTRRGSSFSRCCEPDSTNLVAKKQLFYYAHGFCGSEVQKGHSKDGSSLFHDVWDVDWEGSKSGVSRWLGLESSEASFTHRGCLALAGPEG